MTRPVQFSGLATEIRSCPKWTGATSDCKANTARRLTGWNNVVETGHGLLADAVVGGAEETAEVEIGAGQVAGHAPAAFGRPSAGRQLDHARRTVKQPTKVEGAGRVGVQVAADAGLLVTSDAVHSMLARPAERSVWIGNQSTL